jgi:hypothetical protein
MNRIGLVQVDGKFPNIALMKIATWHRSQGHIAEWWAGEIYNNSYDKIYVSQIFSFSRIPSGVPVDSPNVEIGGTGIDWTNRLPDEIDQRNHGFAWDLYPDYPNHIGFSSKGCRFDCSFCCVPQKDGRPKENASISELLTNPRGGNRLVLLDDDFLAPKLWKNTLQDIIDKELEVCFSQGLNIRTITKEMAEMLAKTEYRSNSFKSKQITFAWDRFEDGDLIKRGLDICLDSGMLPESMQFYVLVGHNSTKKQDMDRVMYLHDRGCKPYVMLFDRTNEERKRFQSWVNTKQLFNTYEYA